MLTNLYSNTPHIQVMTPVVPYINSAPNAGQVRWNPQNNCMEVSNGAGWQMIGGVGSISVSAAAIQDWARAEMHKSQAIKRLAESSPAVADALKTYELAAEQLKVVAILAEKEAA